MPQQVEQLLRSLQTSDRVRAAAWDAVYSVKDDTEAERVLRELPLPDETKATLWDARQGSAPTQSYADMAVDALPMIGGTLGGIVGGIGGTVAGMGVVGVPGALGGAALGGGAGEAAKQLVNRWRGAEAPASAGEAAQAIATQGAVQGGMEGLGRGVTGTATRGARAVYRGFLKPSISQRLAPKADDIVRTALDEALPITRSGVRTGQRVITELRQEVDGILQRSPGTVDLHKVAERVRAFAKQRYYKPGADQRDYQAALAVADRLDIHPSLGIPPGVTPKRVDVPLSKANEAKRALDTSVGDTGFGVKTGAERTTEKAARRVLRGELEAKAPTIAPLNARESKLIDATRAIHQAVQRESNRNVMFGVPTIISGGVGGAEYARTGDATSATAKALALRIGMHPAVASRIAITAARLSRKLGISASTAARLAVYVASEDVVNEPEQ